MATQGNFIILIYGVIILNKDFNCLARVISAFDDSLNASSISFFDAILPIESIKIKTLSLFFRFELSALRKPDLEHRLKIQPD